MPKEKICLFVPHSTDTGGVGEYMRCLNIARTLSASDASWQIRFVLHKDAPYSDTHPFIASFFSGHYHSKDAHEERQRVILQELKLQPRVVIFDSCGNGQHFLYCYKSNIPAMYISSHRGAKPRAFRLPGLLGIDLHWIVPTYPGDSFLSRKERFLSRIFGTRLRLLPTVYCPENTDEASHWLKSRNIDPLELVTLIPGGGMYSVEDKPAAHWFLAAAELAQARLNCKCLVVTGKKFSQASGSANVICVDQIPNPLLMGILKLSRVAVIGAGDLTIQCLSLRVPVIAIPLGPQDQELRASQCASRKLLIKTSHAPSEIVDALQRIFPDSLKRTELLNNMENLDLRNGALDIVSEIQNLTEK